MVDHHYIWFFVAVVKKAVEGRDFEIELIIELALLAICYILYQFLQSRLPIIFKHRNRYHFVVCYLWIDIRREF